MMGDGSVNMPDDKGTVGHSGYLDELLEGDGKKKQGTTLTGVYLENDILKVLDQLAKKGGRGAKSKLMNEALRKLFTEKGLM